MSDYEKWQSFVASWGSLYCALIFFIAVGFALWPSRKGIYDKAALVPLEED
jgi:cytochrome c oxidase cbb3-type subunit IV